MKGKMDTGTIVIVLGLLVIAAVVLQQKPASVVTTPGPGPTLGPAVAGGCTVEDNTLQAGSWNPLNGTRPDVNAYLVDSLDNTVVSETRINQAITNLGTANPTTFSGYVMIGNDNFLGTDRGATDLYFTKKPVQWSCSGAVVEDLIPVYPESNVTLTTYDDGTSEVTANVTVGSGATVDTTELRLAVDSRAAIGNPQLDRPIAFCANVSMTTDSTLAQWDEIRPLNYDAIIPVPGFLSGRNVVKGQCYVLPIQALVDAPGQKTDYRFFTRMASAASQNPAGPSAVRYLIIDKTYYLDDNNKFAVGWGDESNVASDTDIGIATDPAAQIVLHIA